MFEVQFEKEIPLDLYEELLTGVPSGDSHAAEFSQSDGTPSGASEGTRIYCEFCKGYYYEEYHFGDQDE